MKSIRTLIAASAIALAGFAGIGAANAQVVVTAPSTIVAHLVRSNVPYVPGTVPAHGLAYGGVVYLEAARSLPGIDVVLTLQALLRAGVRTPDDCVPRGPTGQLLYCKTMHRW